MLILISLLLVLPFALFGRNFIKKHSTMLYVFSVIVSVGIVYGIQAKLMLNFPVWLRTYVWDLFANGAIASAMFIVVMFIGALSRESELRKKLMPIRAELSIIACILTLGHNVAFGISYFGFLFKTPELLPLNQLLASIVSLIMIAIMLPLFVTSFYSIRKKMNGKSWQDLQKLAYVFYALMYFHVLLLAIPYAIKGRSAYTIMVAIYSVIFGVYFAMRVSKSMSAGSKFAKTGLWTLASVVCVFTILLSMPNVMIKQETKQVTATNISTNQGQEAVVKLDDKSNEVPLAKADKEEKQKELLTDLQDDKENTQNDKEDTQDNKTGEQKESKSDDNSPSTDVAKENKAENIDDNVQLENTEEKAESQMSSNELTQNNNNMTNENEQAVVETVADVEQTSAPAPEDMAQPVPEEVKVPEQEVTPAPEVVAEPEPAPEPQKIYNDGTYTGTGQGYQGPVVVNVVIQNDAITSVYVVSSAEDEPYWSQCNFTTTQRILVAQSANVQTVSGATVSADAIKAGAAAAIESARR